jgi:uncharacterized protein (TIGR03435 family)
VIARRPGGRLEATKTTVRALIKWTYELSEEQLGTGPKWMDKDQFDIVATPEKDAGDDQVSRDSQMRAMTKALLAERFGLRMHRENREVSGFSLITRAGSGLPAPTTHDPGPQLKVSRKNGLRTLAFQAAPMSYVARWLSSQVGRIVVDQTALEGTYDLEFSFAPETTQAAIAATDSPTPLSDTEGPSIFTAIQEEAGLRLQARRLTIPVWIIDAVTPPTEN